MIDGVFRVVRICLQFCRSYLFPLFAIASAVSVLFLYRNILHSPFVYDDLDQIATNSFLLSWRALFSHYVAAAHSFDGTFRGAGGASYRPIFWLSLALDRHFFHLNVTGFHATNLVLHWLNGLLTCLLLRRLGVAPLAAAATALVWLALPINSEAVAWISGRAYGLATLSILLGLLFADRYLKNPRGFLLVCYCGAHMAALLSHEMAIVILPLVLLLAHSRNFGTNHSKLVLCLASGTITLAYVGLRIGSLGFSGAPNSWAILPVGSCIAKYLAWILLPLQMSIERSTETPSNVLSFANIVALLGLLVLLFVIVRLRNRMPAVAAGLAWTLLALAPFSGLVFLYQGMAERYAYLASIGLAFALVSLTLTIKGNARYFVACFLVVLSLWGAWRLNSRILDWRDEVSLYASSLKTNPDSPVLLVNLGSALGDAGHLGDGLFLITRAISFKPDYAFAHQAQGNIWFRLGRFQQAKRAYQKAIELQSGDVKTIVNLGTTYIRLNDLPAAEKEFRRAIALAPRNVPSYCNLGVVLADEGKPSEGVQQLITAIKLEPTNADPYYFLGFIEEQIGANQAAAQMYNKSLQLQPGYQAAQAGLKRLGIGR